MPLSARVRAILEGRNIGSLATLMPDGSPQVTPVWIDTDGDHVLVNTGMGTLKARNARRDPRVAIAVTEREGAAFLLTVRGRVVEMRTEGARAHIDQLARKYTGRERYGVPPGQKRVILVIEPLAISGE